MSNSSGDADALIHILYIDDDEGLALLMQKNLARRGFSVEWAQNGAAGLARIAEGGHRRRRARSSPERRDRT